MDASVKQVIEQGAAASHAGAVSFGELVTQLARHGIESYRVDYRLRQTSYYLPSGETHTVALAAPPVTIGEAFDGASIVDAIRGAQRGEVKYPEFVERTMRAGCVGYTAWLAGRHVTYEGRRGETHVEHFPS